MDTVFRRRCRGALPGETYIPRVPSAQVTDIARVLIGDRSIKTKIVGIRPGEKVHEILVSEEEAHRTVDRGEYYAIQPMLPELRGKETRPPCLTKEYSSADNIMTFAETTRVGPQPGIDAGRNVRRISRGPPLKIMTILGTRPEIIRLSLIVKLLDRHVEHFLVHTGQNYDDRLSGIFFRELDMRQPDASLEVRASGFGNQLGQILSGVERLMQEYKPDRVLILGDTNSGLAAIIARRMDIPVYHMEAGNRCYDFRVPEEANRRIIDHVSSVLMPYTNRSRENLLREGIAGENIYVTGNPISEVLLHFSDKIAASARYTPTLNVKEKGFFLVTMHRAEECGC